MKIIGSTSPALAVVSLLLALVVGQWRAARAEVQAPTVPYFTVHVIEHAPDGSVIERCGYMRNYSFDGFHIELEFVRDDTLLRYGFDGVMSCPP